MFERLEDKMRETAERRVRARVADLAGQEVPAGVRVSVEDGQVTLSGRGLMRRLVGDGALREWRP